MSYPPEFSAELISNCNNAMQDLQWLTGECVLQAQSIDKLPVQEHMSQGAGRRLNILRRSLENIFTIFPPTQIKPLNKSEVIDVNINLHAFVINLFGVFDNWAWAFLLRHGLENQVHRKNISLFKTETKKLLPRSLQEYLGSKTAVAWYEQYLMNYRHALAHRVPLYVPQFTLTPEDSERHTLLEKEENSCIKAHNWERLDEIYVEQENIRRPCFFFLNSASSKESSKPVYLHPQILCDVATVLEFGKLFVQSWQEVS